MWGIFTISGNYFHVKYNPLYFTKVKSGLSARLVCDAVARKYTRKSPHSLRPVPSETQSNFAFRLIRVSFRFHSRIFLRFAFRLIQKITHDLPIKKLANFAFFTKKLSKKSDSFAPKFWPMTNDHIGGCRSTPPMSRDKLLLPQAFKPYFLN